VFTASHECYGHVIADYLDPHNRWISHRYFRDSCHKTPNGYIKDLRVIDRPISNILLIDNVRDYNNVGGL
jgi:CTD small phosphatase-like protein 2